MKIRVRSLAPLVVLGAALAVAPAGADAKTKIKQGFYSSLPSVKKSADVEFHVRSGSKVPDLTLSCYPADTSLIAGTASGFITIAAPKLHISGTKLSFNGTAAITVNGTQVSTTTLDVTLHHVSGPVAHYSFEGNKLKQTTAWKGSGTSPACTTTPQGEETTGGAVTLFGPVAGE